MIHIKYRFMALYVLRQELKEFKPLSEMDMTDIYNWQAIRRVIAYLEKKEKK